MRSPEARAQLEQWAHSAEALLDISAVLFAFSLGDHAGVSVQRFSYHLKALSEDLNKNRNGSDLEGFVQNLHQALFVECGYVCDSQPEHLLQNSDLFTVIETRRGHNLALTILAFCVCEKSGADVDVAILNVGGYYVLQLSGTEGQRMLLDVCEACRVLQAPDLRHIVKSRLGAQAELSAAFYQPQSKRALILALQNMVKFRLIEDETYDAALDRVLLMRAFWPDEYRLLFEEGVLCSRLDRLTQAAEALSLYIEQAPRDRDRHEAARLLQQVRARQGRSAG